MPERCGGGLLWAIGVEGSGEEMFEDVGMWRLEVFWGQKELVHGGFAVEFGMWVELFFWIQGGVGTVGEDRIEEEKVAEGELSTVDDLVVRHLDLEGLKGVLGGGDEGKDEVLADGCVDVLVGMEGDDPSTLKGFDADREFWEVVIELCVEDKLLE